VITTVKDREDKQRYLLNFAGISSHAYYTGIFLADYILFAIPCCLVVGLAYAFKIESFTNNTGNILLSLLLFGLGFLQLNYLIGFMFSKAE
jgi:hypothetical protein